MRNKRLAQIVEKAVRMRLGGGRYVLDGYNQKVITDGIYHTIIARTFGDNNHFLLEIEDGKADADT